LAGFFNILFSNPLGLLALASIIPLIILYLLRPKTIDLNIPSLLFILKREEQRSKLSLLFRRLIRDPLFLIQLLVLILLSLAIAGPYIMDEKVSGEHTVIIIDNSASMQAGGRLDSAKDMAANRLSAVNSVIWAQNVPVLALKEKSTTRAKEVIAITPQRAVACDLTAAITYAERISGAGGSIIVFSDFAGWTGDDPLVAKSLAEYNGVKVEFVGVDEPGNGNIGFVNGWIDISNGKYNLNLAIKNYNEQNANVQLEIRNGDASQSATLDIPAHTTSAYIVPGLNTGRTEVTISGGSGGSGSGSGGSGGGLGLDDTAYAFIPPAAGGSILLVDSRDQTPLRSALGLLSAGVEHSRQLPQDLFGYDIVILGILNNGSIDWNVLNDFVKGGGTLIAMASSSLVNSNNDLLPVSITGISNDTKITVVAENPLTGSIAFEDIEVVHYIKGTVPDGATVLVEASGGGPILSHWRKGKGTVVYLGLNDITGDNAWSGFNTMPEFPLFWKNMIDWIGGTDIEQYNVLTGTVTKLPAEQTISCPDGNTVTTNNLWIDQVGFYEIGEQVLAANLYDSKESNVDEVSLDVSSVTSKYIERPQTVSTEGTSDIIIYLILLVFCLVFLELYVIHRRRELF